MPVLNLRRVYAPDEHGRQRLIDVLTLDFDYGGVRIDGADDSAFIRIKSPSGPVFIRRDPTAEADALEVLRPDNFVQMRVNDGKSARGQRVLVFSRPGCSGAVASFRCGSRAGSAGAGVAHQY